MGAYEVGATGGGAIVYLYDPLYRLIAANYGDGATFNYTYDAVGNRLSLKYPDGKVVTDTYDLASRLVQVKDWQTQATRYTYDSASRLSSAVQGANTYTFAYSGMGDRMRQVAGGITTTYTLDLNAGLTQVLADGTNTYLYGNGRIAQYAGTTPAYFLGDALGSVRQLTNASGAVTLANSAVISNTASGDDGGGLHNTNGGTLTLLSSTVMSNTSGLKGGGVFNNAGTLTLTASAVLSNTAGDSGGGMYHNGGTLTILNSTFSGNRANDDGGGVRSTNSGVATLSNVTLTGRAATPQTRTRAGWGMAGASRAGAGMLPTHVGMNRLLRSSIGPRPYAPHASGDEPKPHPPASRAP